MHLCKPLEHLINDPDTAEHIREGARAFAKLLGCEPEVRALDDSGGHGGTNPPPPFTPIDPGL